MDKTATLRVARGAVWYDGAQYSRLVEWCGKYRVGSVGFRLVEEVEDSALTDPNPLRVYRGESWHHRSWFSRNVFRCRCDSDAMGIGIRLVEEVIDG